MESQIKFKPNPKYRLMDQVREVLRYHHYAYKTEQTYSSWILQYIKFYGGKTHPKDMGKNEVERFLSYLAEKKNVAVATQKQALNALVFLYKRALIQAKIHKKAGCRTFRHHADSRIMPTKRVESGALGTPLQFKSA